MKTFIIFLFLIHTQLRAEVVDSIKIEGNGRVETDAILASMTSKVGKDVSGESIRKDVKDILALGFFSQVSVFQDNSQLIVVVKEKPAVGEILIKGNKDISQEDLSKILETKVYQILEDSHMVSDVRKIEKKYAEKGFYLADVRYHIEPLNQEEVRVVFQIDEGGKVLVGDVHILGHQFFSKSDLLDKMILKPYSRSSSIGSSSIYQTDKLSRDSEFLEYYYRDFGFADIKVAKPLAVMDPDKKFVRVTFQLEEGIQYQVGKVQFARDVGESLYTEEELLKEQSLQEGKLFRHSQFVRDIEKFVELYGDLGYAFTDVNPVTTFHKDSKTVDIVYEIEKGEKVYFGSLQILGNTKTRDNVIRREMEIADTELYSGTKMTESKENLQRLGYFEEVQILKERDEGERDKLNLKLKVKEKSTGSFNASLGYAPAGETTEKFFGQGRYEEKNQSGFGWTTSLSLKFSSFKNYEADAGFYNPKVNDSKWSLGLYYSYVVQETRYGAGLDIPEKRQSFSIVIGRDIIEYIRGYMTLRKTIIKSIDINESHADLYALFDDFQSNGIKNTVTFSIARERLDNAIDPSKGTTIKYQEAFSGGKLLGGDYHFRESILDGNWYIPFDMMDDFRTYLKLHGLFSKLSKISNKPIPSSERYRLGGINSMRGFDFWDIGPKERRLRSPTSSSLEYNLGGNRQLLFQTEYFLPLIPQAGMKFVLFWDTGKVFREDQSFNFDHMEHDVGFGLRWITPFGPLRFEWATPYDKKTGTFGDLNFIFNMGY